MKFILYTILLFFITFSCYKLMGVGANYKSIDYTIRVKDMDTGEIERLGMKREQYCVNPLIVIMAYIGIIAVKIFYDNYFNKLTPSLNSFHKMGVWALYIFINIIYCFCVICQFNFDNIFSFSNSDLLHFEINFIDNIMAKLVILILPIYNVLLNIIFAYKSKIKSGAKIKNLRRIKQQFRNINNLFRRQIDEFNCI